MNANSDINTVGDAIGIRPIRSDESQSFAELYRTVTLLAVSATGTIVSWLMATSVDTVWFGGAIFFGLMSVFLLLVGGLHSAEKNFPRLWTRAVKAYLVGIVLFFLFGVPVLARMDFNGFRMGPMSVSPGELIGWMILSFFGLAAAFSAWGWYCHGRDWLAHRAEVSTKQ